MKRLFIVCEGQTEEQFVRDMLAPHLTGHGLAVTAPLIGHPGHKGGNVTWDRLAGDLRRLLRGDSGAVATTLIDFYGIASDFPGVSQAKRLFATAAKANAVQTAMATAAQAALDVGPDRFLPYIQMHEFEGLLLSDPDGFANGIGEPSLAAPLHAIRTAFDSPEDINHGSDTAPSKRIARLKAGYDKPLHGVLAARRIGLPQMRTSCPLFDAWISRLECIT